MTSKTPLPWFILLPLAIFEAIYWPFATTHNKYKDCREYRPIRPLSRTRKRALTLPLPESSCRGRKPQQTHSQSQSLFLHLLSYDIRRQIYEYVLAPPEVLRVVDTYSGRLGSVRCFASRPGDQRRRHLCTYKGYDHDQDNFRQPIYLSLLYLCRQTSVRANKKEWYSLLTVVYRYSESVHVLYTQNTLAIHDDVLRKFPRAMLPHRLTSIRKINLETITTSKTAHQSDSSHTLWKDSNRIWMDACQVLCEMGTCDLQKLEIRINYYAWGRKREGDLGPNDDLLLGMLNPLLHVKVPEFRVILHSWPQQKEDVLRVLGADPPFSIDTEDF